MTSSVCDSAAVQEIKDEVVKVVKQKIQKVAPKPVILPSSAAGSSLQFPYHVMDGFAGELANAYSQHIESPPEFFYMAALTCLGSYIADRVTLLSEVRQQPRLNVLLLGESAETRKSTAIKKTIELFKGAYEDFAVCYGVGSAEGLQRRLQENPNLLLYLDELKQFVGKCRIDSSVLLPCVTTLFESNKYESSTKKGSIIIDKEHLSILAACTLQTYETIWDSQFTNIGFNNRLFIVPGKGARSILSRTPSQSPRRRI
jgi:hypothetical protein